MVVAIPLRGETSMFRFKCENKKSNIKYLSSVVFSHKLFPVTYFQNLSINSVINILFWVIKKESNVFAFFFYIFLYKYYVTCY